MPTLKEMKAIANAALAEYWQGSGASDNEHHYRALANPARFKAMVELLESIAPFMRDGLERCDEPQCSFCNTARDMLAKLVAMEAMT